MTVPSLHAVLGLIRRGAGEASGDERTDRQLLGCFTARRDEKAFAELVHRHGQLVWGTCWRVLRHHQDVEDAFQGTFLVLARKAGSVRWHASVGGWLYEVASRVAAELRTRRARHELQRPLRAGRPLAEGAREEGWRDCCQALDEELPRLPERHRLPLVLCYLEGRTRDQAARQLGWSLRTLDRRLEQGRELLRQRLVRRGLSMSVGLLAAMVSESARAELAPALVRDTVRQACRGLVPAGQLPDPLTPGITVANEVMRTMTTNKMMVVALLLVAGLTAGGVGVLAHHGLGTEAQAPPEKEGPGKAGEPGEAAERGDRVDLYGDPLPAGTVARLGSLRMRHAGLSEFILLPDGKRVLTAGSDRVLRFWDLATGRGVRTVRLGGSAGPGRCVTLALDGKTLTAVDRGNIVLWEVETGKELKTRPSPTGDVAFLYFTPDGKTLAIGGWKPEVVLWDWKEGTERRVELPARKVGRDSTYHLCFSPDGKRFAAGGGWGEQVCVYERATGREVFRFTCDAYTSAFSPDGKRLAIVTMPTDKKKPESVLRLFDLTSGKEVARFPQGIIEGYFHLAFTPDGKKLACGFSDKSCLLELASGRVLYRLPDRPLSPTFSPDGQTLITSTGHHLRLWDVATGKERQARPGDFGYRPVVALSPDDRFLAAADWLHRSVAVWEIATGRLHRQLPLNHGEQQYVRSLRFSPDGKRLIAGQYDGFLSVWEVNSGKEVRMVHLDDPGRPNKASVYFYSLHLSGDGKRVSTVEQSFGRSGLYARLALWDGQTGKLLRQQPVDSERQDGLYLEDGKAVVLALKEGLTWIDVATGQVRFTIPGVQGGKMVAASPDGRLLAAPLQTVKGEWVGVWETATGKEVGVVMDCPAEHLALMPNRRFLVTTDVGWLRVWDLATGKERKRWPLPEAMKDSWGRTFVTRLCLSSSGRRAITTLADGTALVWDLTPAFQPPTPVKKPDTRELDQWWADLAGEDARKAYAAVWGLAEAPEAAVALVGRLKPAEVKNLEQIRKHITDLDSEDFTIREKAFARLERLGPAAVPAIEEALGRKPSLEVRRRLETLLSRTSAVVNSPETRRAVRGVAVLETIGTREARRLLAELAKGTDNARQTQEAKAALERLARGRGSP